MAVARLIRGGRVPLFDRLADARPGEPAEARPQRLLDGPGLRRSVAAELDRLLNTRAPVAAWELDARERTAIDYGIPDLSLFSPRDPDSEARLAGTLARTIAVYEPRLTDIRVAVSRPDEGQQQLIALVEATLSVNGLVEAFSYPVVIGVDPDGLGDD